MYSVGSMWISEPSLKYNCVVLLLSQLYWLFIYASKDIFSQTTIVKLSQNWLISLKLSEFTELPTGCEEKGEDLDSQRFVTKQTDLGSEFTVHGDQVPNSLPDTVE